MRLVPLSQLVPGTTLAQDIHVPGDAGPPLLRRGIALDARYVKALAGKGVTSVWVEDSLSEGFQPARALTPETERRTVAAVGNALSSASDALAAGRGLSPKAVEELSDVALLIADEVHGAPDVALHLTDMMGADKYLLQHIIDVTALGTVLAARLFRQNGWVDYDGRRRRDSVDPRLAKIALGLLLHDIGKLAIPAEILQKEGPLDEREWAVMRTHPTAGTKLLGDNVSFLIRAVVKQHHERWDGTGYPDNLAGDQIHQFARIAAVADVYDAVTSERVYKPAKKPHEGVTIIEQGDGTDFDPEVVSVFSRVVMPFPPGSEVTLADGREGLVVDVDPRNPYEPTVRVLTDTGRVEEIKRALLAVPVSV
ncbi:MAG TPA: HD-GYP domain-containing protein [Solirubrobacteraceae bacterium]|nr:HD-GYP domain-containing protein [Solirubrobacteraceae bacterium]